MAAAKKYLMMVAAIARAYWGPQPKLMRWVWRCVVRPKETYACVTWAQGTESEYIKDRLRSFQRLGMSLYAPVPKSVPTRAMEVSTDTIPLHLYLLKEGLCAYIRLHRLLPLEWDGLSHSKRHNVSHRLYWRRLLEQNNLLHLLGDFDYTIEATPEQKFVSLVGDGVFRDPGEGFLAFTDGSKAVSYTHLTLPTIPLV